MVLALFFDRKSNFFNVAGFLLASLLALMPMLISFVAFAKFFTLFFEDIFLFYVNHRLSSCKFRLKSPKKCPINRLKQPLLP